MAGRTARHDIPEAGRMPDVVLALTRQFLAELNPGARRTRPVTLDSALDRTLDRTA